MHPFNSNPADNVAHAAILQKIFPHPTAEVSPLCYEVNGLPKNTIPQNCEIIASGQTTSRTERYATYLLSIDNVLVYMRICAATEGSSYAEFAAVRGIATSDSQKATLTKRAHHFIERNCSP